MIKINRNSQPAPTSLITQDNPTDKERKKAKLHYESLPEPTKAYEFTKYKESDVVETLNKLFHRKCAYCESHYGAVSPMDVEHYRPKGGINECPTHKGYWWLALDWNNLLPSCIDCNRVRRHKKAILNLDGSIVTTSEDENSGKGNSFPTLGNNFAMQESDNHNLEEPLIINPCDIDPQHHLQWSIDDPNLPIVICTTNNAGLPDVKGENTIKILGLNRWGLVNERGKILQQLAVVVSDIYDLIETTLDIPIGEKRERHLIKLGKKIDYLKSFGTPDKEYSAMSKSFIENELKKLRSLLTMQI
ncbi:hypothetical protein MKU80_014730 [Providencia rettgeri]|nr:hypothetical protein [Providencia rettgeri]